MPKPVKVTSSPAEERVGPAPTAPAQVQEAPFKVLIMAKGHDGPITGPIAAKALGIQTEAEYAAAQAAAIGVELKNGKKRPDIKLPDEFVTFVDPNTKERVCCVNNKHNREFKMGPTLGYKQTILDRGWAGPTTMEGQTINGESISISRSWQILSGQKRLVAVWLAWREWVRDYEKWAHLWPKEAHPDGPVIESIVVYGVSDDLKVVQTIDNVDPRSEADTFFVGEENSAVAKIFGADRINLPVGHKQHVDRKERVVASKMLATAVDFAWKRVGWDQRKIKTNLAAQEFLDLFPGIYRAVRHVHQSARSLALLRVSPGTMAGAMLLMATGKTNPMKEFDSEADLDGSLWPKAEQFVTALAKKEGQFFILTANTLAKVLSDEGEELNGNADQKFAIIAQAWRLWIDGKKLTPVKDGGEHPQAEELGLRTQEGENGVVKLVEPPDFGGVDRGPKGAKPEEVQADPPAPTAEQIAADKAKIKAENARLLKEKAEAAKDQAKPKALTPTPTTAKPVDPKATPKPAANGKKVSPVAAAAAKAKAKATAK